MIQGMREVLQFTSAPTFQKGGSYVRHFEKRAKKRRFRRGSGAPAEYISVFRKIHIPLEQAEPRFGLGLFINGCNVPLYHPPGNIQAVGYTLQVVFGGHELFKDLPLPRGKGAARTVCIELLLLRRPCWFRPRGEAQGQFSPCRHAHQQHAEEGHSHPDGRRHGQLAHRGQGKQGGEQVGDDPPHTGP